MNQSRFISVGKTFADSVELANGNRFIAREIYAPPDWEFFCGGCDLPAFVPERFRIDLATTAPFDVAAPNAMGLMVMTVIGLGTPVRRARATSNQARGTYRPPSQLDGRNVAVSALAVAEDEEQLNRLLGWLSATLEKELAQEGSLFIGECDSSVLWEIPACRNFGGLRVTDHPDDGVAQITFTVTSISPDIVEVPQTPLGATGTFWGIQRAPQHYACCEIYTDLTGCTPYIPPLATNAPGCFCEPWEVYRMIDTNAGIRFDTDRVINVRIDAGSDPYENFTDEAGLPEVHPTSNLRIAIFDPAAVPGVPVDFGDAFTSQTGPEAPANQWWCKALVGSALIGNIPAGATLRLSGSTGRTWIETALGEVVNIDSQVQSVGRVSLSEALRIPIGEERIILIEADAYNTAEDTTYTLEWARSTVSMADSTR